MSLKHLRVGAALALLGFVIVFFVPVIYDPTMFQCANPSFACLSDPSGLKSIGYTLFHWGGAYSFGGAGVGEPLRGYAFLPDGYFALPDGSRLTTFGVLLSVAFPAVVASVGLAAPEIVKKSLATRIAFTCFGGFIFALSLLMLVSMLSEGLNSILAAFPVVLFPVGSSMVVYGLRPGIFQIGAEDP
jgi:hypothetical protein